MCFVSLEVITTPYLMILSIKILTQKRVKDICEATMQNCLLNVIKKYYVLSKFTMYHIFDFEIFVCFVDAFLLTQ